MADSTVHGHCLCNGVRFSVKSSTIRFGFASCHCNNCRLSLAAPFALWSGMFPDTIRDFVINDGLCLTDASTQELLNSYRSSPDCVRYFCRTCGTSVCILYDGGRWEKEVHFPTALLDSDGISTLEAVMKALEKPRYLHVFSSDRSPCLGNLVEWANGPKYGGATGLEPLDEANE